LRSGEAVSLTVANFGFVGRRRAASWKQRTAAAAAAAAATTTLTSYTPFH